MPDLIHDEFLDDLCPRVRPIVAHVMNFGCGCQALDLFQNRARTWNETADIAYYLQQPTEQVIQTLNLLLDLGVIERRDILDSTFYRLTEDAEILHALDQYWTWREVWRSRWRNMHDALKL